MARYNLHKYAMTQSECELNTRDRRPTQDWFRPVAERNKAEPKQVWIMLHSLFGQQLYYAGPN